MSKDCYEKPRLLPERMEIEKPLPRSFYEKKKMDKLGVSKTETVEEYLVRGGEITKAKRSSKNYHSWIDRDWYETQEYNDYQPDDHENFDPSNVSFDVRSKFYETQEWKSLRYKFIQSKKTEELVCQCCGKGPFSRENWKEMNIDHIKPVKKFWEERLNMDNLQILCWMCNRIKLNNYTEPFKLGDGAKRD